MDTPIAVSESKISTNAADFSRENSGPRLTESDRESAGGNDLGHEFPRMVAELAPPGAGPSQEPTENGEERQERVALRLDDIIKSSTPDGGGKSGTPDGGGGSGFRGEIIGCSGCVKKEKSSDENEKTLLEVRALLNKLAPRNYEKLVQRMKDGEIPFHETPERLHATLGLIFDKALEEPNYAELYARMCRDLIETEAKDAQGAVVKFRTVLLQQTQRYYERTQKEEEEAEQEKNEEDPEALLRMRAKAKRHYLANIRFISELYKVEMLTDRVILSCFQKLLPKKTNFEDADEEKLESLCKLLQTCAKMIKEQNTVDIIFVQLKKMINAGVSSSRIRFMMEDTIDLKNNNYVPRNARPILLL